MNAARTDFVPLTAGLGKGGAPAGMKAHASSGQPNAFRPLETSAAAAPRPFHASCEPRVSIQRDGDRVTSIHIQCGCGQVIDLACVYDDLRPGSV